jgi:three-Cys-motif partner protein
MGQTVRKPLVYIDGFAGPGHYTNYSKGSPVAALVAALSARAACKAKWKAGDTHCIFIEMNPEFFDHLSTHIQPFRGQQGLLIHCYHDSFEEGVSAAARDVPSAINDGAARFSFIDPFGAKGVPFSVVRQLLSSPLSEVMVNLDADGLGRIFEAGDWASHEKLLTSVFGDASWKTALTARGDFPQLCRQILDLYAGRLRSIPKVDFVWPFEMATKTGAIDYFLVFASRHPEGMRKMKQSMRRIGQGGEYRFCDASVGQVHFDLHSAQDLAIACDAVCRRFAGQRATYDDLDRFMLKETNYFDPKRTVITLEGEGRAVVSARPGVKRRKGSFVREDVAHVTFKE